MRGSQNVFSLLFVCVNYLSFPSLFSILFILFFISPSSQASCPFPSLESSLLHPFSSTSLPSPSPRPLLPPRVSYLPKTLMLFSSVHLIILVSFSHVTRYTLGLRVTFFLAKFQFQGLEVFSLYRQASSKEIRTSE